MPPALKYKTPEELQAGIDAYFKENVGVTVVTDDEGNAVTDKNGKAVYEVKPPTISGLALYLGFLSRQSLYDYKDRPMFSDTIKRATLAIEEFAEKQLFTNNSPTGAIFWLKNKGWKDKTEMDLNADHTIRDYSQVSDEDIEQELAETLAELERIKKSE